MRTSYLQRPLFLFMLALLLGTGQKGFAKNKLESPFVIGLKGGANLSHVMVLRSFEIFTSLGGEESPPKVYNPFYSNPGYQYGFVGLYSLTDNLNLIFEPTFTHYLFTYTRDISWQDSENTGFSRTSSQTHKQNIHYIEFPLVLQYYFDLTPLKPYILAGGYYGYLTGAEKILSVEEYTTIDNQNFNTSEQQQHLYVNDQYIRSRIAILAEIGAIYDLTALRIMFGISYNYSFNNISRENERYANQLVTGVSYDVNDNLKLNSLHLNVRVLFPINKPSNLIKSLKCK
jgi:opacity protein-like surface antigen